jgi:carboxymethylenebutenolidase
VDRVYVMELVRSFQCGFVSRREFLKRATAALGSVVAANALLAACGPAPTPTAPVVVATAPAAVTPDAVTGGVPTAGNSRPAATGTQAAPHEPAQGDRSGLVFGRVEYPDPDGQTLIGYLARPEDGGPLPAVVVIQEWWGLNEHIEDVTRRLATNGFVALAPDLYHGVVVSEPDEARKMVLELDMEEAVREIRHAVGFLLSQEYAAGTAAGIVGFCMGGRLALHTSRVEEKLGAVVAFYGSPLEPAAAREVKAPLLGLYGAEDGGISEASIRSMEGALDGAGIENEIHIYQGVGHAFFNDTAASYRPDAAADAWQRSLDWLRAHLSG